MIVEDSAGRAHLTDRIMPSLLVHNLEETLVFYQDVLGFAVNDLESEGFGPSWAIVSRDDVSIQFFSHSHHAIPSVPTFSGMLRLFTEDIDTFVEEMKDVAEIEWSECQPDGKTCEVAIRDPNGYVLSFCSAY